MTNKQEEKKKEDKKKPEKFNYKKFSEYRRKNPAKFIAGLDEGSGEVGTLHDYLNSMPRFNRDVIREAFEKAKKKKKTKEEQPKPIEVKGATSEDKFQKEPIVTPLTTTYTKG